jgi:hypothetical protein
MTLVELIDLIDENGDIVRKFFGIQDFYEKVQNPLINHYTFDFKFIQKNDIELKEEILNLAKKYDNFEIIKFNLENAKMSIRPSNVAEEIVNEYKKDLRKPSYEVNDKLIDVYKSMGFGNGLD